MRICIGIYTAVLGYKVPGCDKKGGYNSSVAGEAGLTDIDDAGRVRPKPATRGEQRRRAFLDAAADVFLEQGYEAASVNEVVRRAGGSLATLYAQFGNKDGLFQAVIEDITERYSEAIIDAADTDLPLEQGLQQIGEQFLGSILRPRAIAFTRVMIGEGRKIPDMMERWILSGPERVRAAVSEFLLSRGCKGRPPSYRGRSRSRRQLLLRNGALAAPISRVRLRRIPDGRSRSPPPRRDGRALLPRRGPRALAQRFSLKWSPVERKKSRH